VVTAAATRWLLWYRRNLGVVSVVVLAFGFTVFSWLHGIFWDVLVLSLLMIRWGEIYPCLLSDVVVDWVG
jgi:hypothetical protein